MGLIPLNRHFKNRRGEDPGNKIAVDSKDFGSIFHHAHTLTTLLHATLFFSLQITYRNPKFLSISFTACLTSLIFQQYSKGFREEFK